MLRVILILIPVAVTIYALIDAITAPRDEIRSLPKWLWIFMIIVLFFGGAVLWFFFGRPNKASREGGSGGGGGGGTPRPQGPDDDPDFLSKLDWEKRRNPEKPG